MAGDRPPTTQAGCERLRPRLVCGEFDDITADNWTAAA